jgi:hypothetical protein
MITRPWYRIPRHGQQIAYHFKVELGELEVDGDVEGEAARADRGQQLRHVIALVELQQTRKWFFGALVKSHK